MASPQQQSLFASIRNESVAEFTFKAVITGVLLGLVFGAANVYLGLRIGMTASASIPAVVISVVMFKLFSKKSTELEVNLSQTIGSSSVSLATGTIYTMPALFMWDIVPPYMQIVVLSFLGGILGLAAMIPLRKMLIVDAHEELPYPEGKACAEVIKATTHTSDDSSSSGRWIFLGLGIGAAVKLLIGALFLIPAIASYSIPVLSKAQVAVELAPAVIAVGYILGYKHSGVLVSGSLLSALVLTPLIAWIGASLTTPLAPEVTNLIANMDAKAIWSSYVRYIGAGAVATAGIFTVLKNMPSMFKAFSSVFDGLKKNKNQDSNILVKSTERDLPSIVVVIALLIVFSVSAFVPGVFSGDMPLSARLVGACFVSVFGVLFVAVMARIAGIVGVSSQPTSSIALVTLLCVATFFAAKGWNDIGARAAVLTIATIVTIAASKAGDISQDLKTGFLIGATPAKQQFGQLIGVSCVCWVVAGTLLLLGKAYQFGSVDLPSPQAALMKTIIEGVLSGSLPWGLVLTGVGITLIALISGISALIFAIGVYLPLSTMLPLFIGGCVRRFADSRSKDNTNSESNPGVLAASGLVAGEGLAGVTVAGLVAFGMIPKGKATIVSGNIGMAITLLAIGLLCLFLYRAGLSGSKKAK